VGERRKRKRKSSKGTSGGRLEPTRCTSELENVDLYCFVLRFFAFFLVCCLCFLVSSRLCVFLFPPGGDVNRLYLVGQSAGGHIVALIALLNAKRQADGIIGSQIQSKLMKTVSEEDEGVALEEERKTRLEEAMSFDCRSNLENDSRSAVVSATSPTSHMRVQPRSSMAPGSHLDFELTLNNNDGMAIDEEEEMEIEGDTEEIKDKNGNRRTGAGIAVVAVETIVYPPPLPPPTTPHRTLRLRHPAIRRAKSISILPSAISSSSSSGSSSSPSVSPLPSSNDSSPLHPPAAPAPDLLLASAEATAAAVANHSISLPSPTRIDYSSNSIFGSNSGPNSLSNSNSNSDSHSNTKPNHQLGDVGMNRLIRSATLSPDCVESIGFPVSRIKAVVGVSGLYDVLSTAQHLSSRGLPLGVFQQIMGGAHHMTNWSPKHIAESDWFRETAVIANMPPVLLLHGHKPRTHSNTHTFKHIQMDSSLIVRD